MDIIRVVARTTIGLSIVSGIVLLTFLLGFNNIIPLLTPHYVKGDLPKYGTLPTHSHYGAIIQLHRNGRGFCSAVVIDANYALTAAHCVLKDFFGIDKTPIRIHDDHGNDTGIDAEVVASHGRVDVAMIQGNFNEFNYLQPDFYGFTPTNNPGVYQACGFPGLQDKLTCTIFVPTHNVGFSIAGKGFLIPGMSGGPVYDAKSRVVIAVNSAATNGFVLVAPLLGILGSFGVEP